MFRKTRTILSKKSDSESRKISIYRDRLERESWWDWIKTNKGRVENIINTINIETFIFEKKVDYDLTTIGIVNIKNYSAWRLNVTISP